MLDSIPDDIWDAWLAYCNGEITKEQYLDVYYTEREME